MERFQEMKYRSQEKRGMYDLRVLMIQSLKQTNHEAKRRRSINTISNNYLYVECEM